MNKTLFSKLNFMKKIFSFAIFVAIFEGCASTPSVKPSSDSSAPPSEVSSSPATLQVATYSYLCMKAVATSGTFCDSSILSDPSTFGTCSTMLNLLTKETYTIVGLTCTKKP